MSTTIFYFFSWKCAKEHGEICMFFLISSLQTDCWGLLTTTFCIYWISRYMSVLNVFPCLIFKSVHRYCKLYSFSKYSIDRQYICGTAWSISGMLLVKLQVASYYTASSRLLSFVRISEIAITIWLHWMLTNHLYIPVNMSTWIKHLQALSSGESFDCVTVWYHVWVTVDQIKKCFSA